MLGECVFSLTGLCNTSGWHILGGSTRMRIVWLSGRHRFILCIVIIVTWWRVELWCSWDLILTWRSFLSCRSSLSYCCITHFILKYKVASVFHNNNQIIYSFSNNWDTIQARALTVGEGWRLREDLGSEGWADTSSLLEDWLLELSESALGTLASTVLEVEDFPLGMCLVIESVPVCMPLGRWVGLALWWAAVLCDLLIVFECLEVVNDVWSFSLESLTWAALDTTVNLFTPFTMSESLAPSGILFLTISESLATDSVLTVCSVAAAWTLPLFVPSAELVI